MDLKRWEEVERIFNAALELEPGARGDFLNRACGGNESLRADVKSLLQHSESGGPLEAPAIEIVARKIASDSEQAEESSSMVGKILSHYQITTRLGKGGMGEVYQAKDQTLGRDIAIKVLPEEFAKDADRVARFRREAKLLASLNHPNIAAIHGLEESGGTSFLVLELVDGETIEDRLARGPIPFKESLKLAIQIAEALEAAHEKGVIHRDLKPANIKIMPDGKVKVLDFGLAKTVTAEGADLNHLGSPTSSRVNTRKGIILGTTAYMSPEQASGQEVDKRADIWAFGCVLYEMLTGRTAFSGKSIADIVAAIIRMEPEWSNLPPNLHWRVREIIERCLEKEARDRYSAIGDARVDIQKVLADPSGLSTQPAARLQALSVLPTILPWLTMAAVLGAIIAAVVVWNLKPTGPEVPLHVTRFSYDLPAGQQFGDLFESVLAVSPDGRRMVYSTNAGLYLRFMDGLDAKLIPGTGGNRQRPFFSPDGKWVGFYSETDRKLMKIAISGGIPVPIADALPVGSISWAKDGTIVYADGGPRRGLMKVSAEGGIPKLVIEPSENEVFISPQILPDGKSMLFTDIGSQPSRIEVQSPSGQRKKLLMGDSARFLATGHLLYAVGNTILAVPFDVHRLELVGEPVPVIKDISRPVGAPQYAVSDSGTMCYLPAQTGDSIYERELVWVNREGKEEPLILPPGTYSSPRISPDGKQICFGRIVQGNRDIWIWDILRENMTRLTTSLAADAFPLWTPDGKRIFFHTDRNVGTIYEKAADGSGGDKLFASLPGREIIPSSWSPDGKNLAIAEISANPTGFDIGMLSNEAEPKRKQLLDAVRVEAQPQISPDGRWMAYSSDESGDSEI